MAKDPAFLFYPGDYVAGTMHLDFECKGAYIDLLMLQFQKDHMSLHMIKHVLGHTFDHIWPLISDKFQEKDGKYWNERLRVEKEKRISFCKSRKDNRSKQKQVTHHMSPHMEDEDICIKIIRVLEDSRVLNGESENEKQVLGMIVIDMEKLWLKHKPEYSAMQMVDYPALLNIAYHIAGRKGWSKHSVTDIREKDVVNSWEKIVIFLCSTNSDNFLKRQTLDGIANPKIMQKIEEAMNQMISKKQTGMIL